MRCCNACFSIGLIAQYFMVPLWPAIGEALGRREYAWARKVIRRAIAATLIVGCICAVLLLAASRAIMKRWSGIDIGPIDSLRIGFAVWVVLVGYVASMNAILNQPGVMRRHLVLFGGASLASLALKIEFARHGSLAGVVWATVIAFGVLYVIPAGIPGPDKCRARRGWCMNEPSIAKNSRKRAVLYALAIIPFLDCIVNQLNFALHITLGPLSLLQLVHGSFMLAFICICIAAAWRDVSQLARVPIPALCAFLLIGMACTKELIVKGSLTMASAGPYGQMAYWVLFWITVCVLCDGEEDTEILLRGLAAGAIATAISVFIGLAFGAPNYYKEDGVLSSAGWFDTGKMITGVMNTGGVVLLYLGRKRASWFYPLLTGLCFAASVVTYARAGWVALIAIVLWLSVWAMLFGRGGNRLWVKRFLALVLAVACLVPLVTNVGKIFARWADVSQGDQAGSGRATFWKIAAVGYLNATPAEQALGRGYASMADLLLREYGMDIRHTHNDLLDMLTVGGLAGACWLFLFIATLSFGVLRSSLFTVEGAAGAAILLNYLLHSQFTGQIWGTDAMSYYLIALSCLFINAREHQAIVQRASTTNGLTSTTKQLSAA